MPASPLPRLPRHPRRRLQDATASLSIADYRRLGWFLATPALLGCLALLALGIGPALTVAAAVAVGALAALVTLIEIQYRQLTRHVWAQAAATDDPISVLAVYEYLLHCPYPAAVKIAAWTRGDHGTPDLDNIPLEAVLMYRALTPPADPH